MEVKCTCLLATLDLGVASDFSEGFRGKCTAFELLEQASTSSLMLYITLFSIFESLYEAGSGTETEDARRSLSQISFCKEATDCEDARLSLCDDSAVQNFPVKLVAFGKRDEDLAALPRSPSDRDPRLERRRSRRSPALFMVVGPCVVIAGARCIVRPLHFRTWARSARASDNAIVNESLPIILVGVKH